MSDHETLDPETDDQLRARLRAFAQEIEERTDTEAALERMPSRSRPPTIRLLAIAACFVLAVVVAVVAADRQSVDTVDPAQSPTTECTTPAQPRAITQGAPMNNRLARPVVTAATAILLLGACSDDDDGPTTLAKGQDIDFVGSGSLADQSMDIDAVEENGEVSGEVSFDPHGMVASLQCQDTETDGLLILGGEVTTPGLDGDEPVGSWISVIIREGEPDAAVVWFGDPGTASCEAALDQVSDADRSGSTLFAVEAGDDIETG